METDLRLSLYTLYQHIHITNNRFNNKIKITGASEHNLKNIDVSQVIHTATVELNLQELFEIRQKTEGSAIKQAIEMCSFL